MNNKDYVNDYLREWTKDQKLKFITREKIL